MTEKTNTAIPISRPVTVSVLPSKGFDLKIEANEKERAALAEAHDLDAVEAFVADVELKRWRKDGVRVKGRIFADVVQACVVTLAPVHQHIDAPFEAVFLPEGSRLNRPLDEEGAMIVDPEGADLPETFEGGVIDAGAVAEEFFELAIDPYPRAPDAELPQAESAQEEDADDAAESPFAKLSSLRDKL